MVRLGHLGANQVPLDVVVFDRRVSANLARNLINSLVLHDPVRIGAKQPRAELQLTGDGNGEKSLKGDEFDEM